MKKFFIGNIPSQKFSKGILHANRKSKITFEGKRKSKNSKADLYYIGVKESNCDFTSGLTRPLETEIVFLRFSAITKAQITSKGYKMNGKCLQNTTRKAWSRCRMVTSLPVSNAP
jgi:hypothetical protein